MVDLSKYDTSGAAEAGAVLQLRDPITDKVLIDEQSGEPVTLTLTGADSKLYQRESRKALNRRLNRKVTRSGRIKVDAEEFEGDAIDLLIASTTGWDHVCVEGESLPFSEANVRLLYTRFPWIREQADEFISDRSNFLGNSLMSSTSSQSES